MTFEMFKADMMKLYEDVEQKLQIEPPSEERILELYLAQVVISNFERKALRREW
jgi:hypothetical protein